MPLRCRLFFLLGGRWRACALALRLRSGFSVSTLFEDIYRKLMRARVKKGKRSELAPTLLVVVRREGWELTIG
jgi:hypothetical protein